MNNELEILLDIKKSFSWPVDTLRYAIPAAGRYWDGKKFSETLSEENQRKVELSLQKLTYAKETLKALVKLSWVEMIFVTGSVASLNAIEDDDIDIWLVVSPRRIWLTRAFDFFTYTFSGKRRLSKDGIESKPLRDKLCFNMYTTTGQLHFSQQTVSFAMQFIDAYPIFVRDQAAYERLLRQNEWIKGIFPHWYEREMQKFRNLEMKKYRNTEIRAETIWSKVLDVVEYLAGIAMIAKAEKKFTLSKKQVYRDMFTTWGTPRILSAYDQKTLTERGEKSEQAV